MGKINPAKKIQRFRTEEEMRTALAHFIVDHAELHPEQDEDHAVILSDTIEELLELRAMREQLRGFVQGIVPLLQRK